MCGSARPENWAVLSTAPSAGFSPGVQGLSLGSRLLPVLTQWAPSATRGAGRGGGAGPGGQAFPGGPWPAPPPPAAYLAHSRAAGRLFIKAGEISGRGYKCAGRSREPQEQPPGARSCGPHGRDERQRWWRRRGQRRRQQQQVGLSLGARGPPPTRASSAHCPPPTPQLTGLLRARVLGL